MRMRPPSARRRRRLLLVALALAVLALLLDRGPDWYFDPRSGNPANHILVYTTRWCPVCERLRACFRKGGVPFEERDVETSWRWDREWSAAGGIGVPLTLVGGEVAHGLRQAELEPLLASAGFRVDCWSLEAWRDHARDAMTEKRRPGPR